MKCGNEESENVDCENDAPKQWKQTSIILQWFCKCKIAIIRFYKCGNKLTVPSKASILSETKGGGGETCRILFDSPVFFR